MSPAGFPAYARILHPIDAWPPTIVDLVVEDPGLESWTWAELAARTRSRLDANSEWWDIAGETDSVDGWTFSKPHDGWNDPQALASLVPALRASTTTPEALTLAVWDGWGFASWGDVSEFPLPLFELPDRRYVLGDAALSDLEDPTWPFRAGLGWEPGDINGVMPQFIWPADEAWCVSVEIDAPYTVVAGPHSLIDQIMSLPDLETQVIPEPAAR
ncbi:hypothetical protein ACRAWB_15510 [Leifsonia poae]|uniref:hypothetical protein n=1 Tax=Leifsonia poae TaxID=110933 RepID=UPI003D69C248